MKKYISRSTKSTAVQDIINEALDILENVGVPVNTKSERGLEKMAEAFLAVANVTHDWTTASDDTHLQTRQIITFINKHFEESISHGSYDNIRRKDLKLLVVAELIVNSGDKSSAPTNDPTRGYALHTDFKNLVVQYKTENWIDALLDFNSKKPSLAELLERKRNIEKIPVTLPDGKPLTLSLGEHNVLQKAVIEQFLPRFGSDCCVLYIGDTSNKMLHIEKAELNKLNFFELSHDELPDIIAYSTKNNWLYLIEAVHSSGPMSETRVYELRKLLKNCKAELIFVTAFLTKADFRKWVTNIAWETEVWIADSPDHLIHFNGHKFLGAY
ncbi:type II restriction enzyme [Spirosoma oryzae]|uniref:Type II restriction enzyme n=1 Tax=Spirosoma oryzae TaxID=1469603 RepID=A0A2T0TBI6_9BACT|nr:BsuBI/PstI family type II restriction endonuclease [Spirosoma oryzae]PRY43008.1 type II restriction enzyme [Spirosoma oryzae]